MAKKPQTTEPERCPGCGASFKLIDRVHRCHGRLLAQSAPVPAASDPVTNEPITNMAPGIANKARVERWRKAKPDAYRSYMRDYMKRRRAAK